MMKLSRDQLKDLVKECLTEILLEGIGKQEVVTESRRPQAQPVVTAPRPARRTSALDVPVRPLSEVARPAVARHAETLAGKNPIMRQIFEDTAATTYQEMARSDAGPMAPAGLPDYLRSEAGRYDAAPVTERLDHFAEPLSEQAAIWSELAFAPPRNR
jgi:hypothetical protein